MTHIPNTPANHTTLSAVSTAFRNAVENHYKDDQEFQQQFAQTTPATLMQELIQLQAQLSAADSKDFSQGHHMAVLKFNDLFMQAYTAILGDDAVLEHQLPGQNTPFHQAGYTQLGCPTLARLSKPAAAAAP